MRILCMPRAAAVAPRGDGQWRSGVRLVGDGHVLEKSELAGNAGRGAEVSGHGNQVLGLGRGGRWGRWDAREGAVVGVRAART